MSVCILANDDPQSRAMIAGIAKDHSISAIIFEKKPKGSMLKTLKFRIRRLGYKKVIGQLLLLVYEKMFFVPGKTGEDLSFCMLYVDSQLV